MKIETSTIIRTIILIIALINQVLSATGHSPLPISDEQINELVSTIVTIIISVWTWWKNNSFSVNAIKADKYLAELKNNK